MSTFSPRGQLITWRHIAPVSQHNGSDSDNIEICIYFTQISSMLVRFTDSPELLITLTITLPYMFDYIAFSENVSIPNV